MEFRAGPEYLPAAKMDDPPDAKLPANASPRKGTRKAGPKKSAAHPWYRRPGIVGLLVLAVIVVVVAGALIWRHTRSHVTTDDAFIDGVSQIVSPQISGRVIRVLIDDNQDVRAGQVLVELDPADYRSRLDQAEAAQAQGEAQLAEAQAQQAVTAAQFEEAGANLRTAQANAANAGHQLDRNQRLKRLNAGAVSAQQLDNLGASAKDTGAQLSAAQDRVAAAAAQLGYARSLVMVARAGIRGADAQLAQAALTLGYTRVRARIDGRVANRTVCAGNVVTAGTPLMAVVPRDVYVTANLKETQLTLLRRGQPVKITADAYPALKLTGRVDSVQPGTGDVFSTLPAENATGNWVKVVQRVPVKIDFDPLPDDPGQRLAPGMSVEVSVKVR